MINLIEISKEIEKSVQTRGYPAEIPAFEGRVIYNTKLLIDFNEEKFNDSICNLKSFSFINDYPENFGSGIKSLIKRFIIKCVRFYILPIVEKQNFYNNIVEESLVQIHSYSYVKTGELEKMQEQIKRLQEEINLLRSRELGGRNENSTGTASSSVR